MVREENNLYLYLQITDDGVVVHAREEDVHAVRAVVPERNGHLAVQVACQLSHVRLKLGKCYNEQFILKLLKMEY